MKPSVELDMCAKHIQITSQMIIRTAQSFISHKPVARIHLFTVLVETEQRVRIEPLNCLYLVHRMTALVM